MSSKEHSRHIREFESYDVDKICQVLHIHNMEACIPAIQTREVDGAALLTLTENQLKFWMKDLKKSYRSRLLDLVEQIKEEPSNYLLQEGYQSDSSFDSVEEDDPGNGYLQMDRHLQLQRRNAIPEPPPPPQPSDAIYDNIPNGYSGRTGNEEEYPPEEEEPSLATPPLKAKFTPFPKKPGGQNEQQNMPRFIMSRHSFRPKVDRNPAENRFNAPNTTSKNVGDDKNMSTMQRNKEPSIEKKFKNKFPEFNEIPTIKLRKVGLPGTQNSSSATAARGSNPRAGASPNSFKKEEEPRYIFKMPSELKSDRIIMNTTAAPLAGAKKLERPAGQDGRLSPSNRVDDLAAKLKLQLDKIKDKGDRQLPSPAAEEHDDEIYENIPRVTSSPMLLPKVQPVTIKRGPIPAKSNFPTPPATATIYPKWTIKLPENDEDVDLLHERVGAGDVDEEEEPEYVQLDHGDESLNPNFMVRAFEGQRDYEGEDGEDSDTYVPPTRPNKNYTLVQVNSSQNRYFPVAPTKNDIIKRESYYMNFNRKEAEHFLSDQADGTFLIRPSTQYDQSYTLTLIYQHRYFNIRIRKTIDNTYALGTPKPEEDTFETIQDIIRHHQSVRLILSSGDMQLGSTLLRMIEP